MNDTPPLVPPKPVYYGSSVPEPQETLQNRRRFTDGTADLDLAFYRVYTEDKGGGNKYWIQGGGVTAGTYNTTVADTDIGDVGSEPADGTDVYLEVTGDGYAPSGQLLQGFTGTAASIGSAAAVPANTLPVIGSLTGRKCHLLLGTWNGGVFTASGGGNVSVSFCPGAYTVSRS